MGHYDYKSNSFSFFNNLVWCYSKIVCTKLEFFCFSKMVGKFIARAIADDCLPPAFVSNLGDAPSNSNQA